DCVRGFPEACRAWTILVAALVDRLRSAPRRGSLTPSSRGASPVNPLSDSTRNINCDGLRRDSSFRLSCRDKKSSGKDSVDSQKPTCPVRKNENRGANSDLNGGCVDMASLKTTLPDVRASNPAIA
ncbi:hypothetical protein GCK32_020428, partial [Trichostrongylus colubriformis]